MTDFETVMRVKDALVARFADDSRVNGVGIARGEGFPVVRVNLTTGHNPPDIERVIDGVTVQVVIIGHVVAHSGEDHA